MKKRKSSVPVFLLSLLTLAAAQLMFGRRDAPRALADPAGDQTVSSTQVTAEMDYGGTDGKRMIRAYAKSRGLSLDAWPQSLIDLLDRNPETADFVLGYPELHDKIQTVDMSEYENCDSVPLFLQWDTRWGYISYGSDVAGITGCGPVCLSMAAYYLTRDPSMSPDNIIRFALREGYYVPGNGSSWTLISEGGEKLGLDVTEIPLDENRILANLRVGNPIICVMGPGDFTTSGHYIVLVGIEDGKLRVNDPNSRINSGKLWDYSQIQDQIRDLWVIRRG